MTPLMPPLRNNPILLIAATLCWSLCLGFIPFTYSDEADPDQPFILTPKAKELHQRALVIDGHNDLPWQMRMEAHSSFEEADISQSVPEFHTDIPRLKRGGVDAQFWAAFVRSNEPNAARNTLEQIDLIHRMVDRYPDTFAFALRANDMIDISNQGKIACLIGVEGGHSIENSLPLLRMYYRLGVRYMTLTHADSLAWAGASTDGTELSGLSDFGKEVVLEMNRLGMLVDISHVSVNTMIDTLEVSQAPIIASHSSAFSIAPHPRNVPDAVLEKIADNGGVVMVNFFSGFIDPDAARDLLERTEVPQRLRKEYPNEEEYQAELAKWLRARRQSLSENGGFRSDVGGLVDHIDHIVKVAGIDHVGLGSDYDGISSVPLNLEDVSTFPNITQELLNRGYCENDILKILGGNTLRAMREAEKVAEMIAFKGDSLPNP